MMMMMMAVEVVVILGDGYYIPKSNNSHRLICT